MSPAARRRLRVLFRLALVVVVLGVIACGAFYWQLKRSLPQLDGSATVPGLTASVTVERDALGVPTIRGKSRLDAARALGFLHAQDRFFQMDLARRRAAGELAELVGKNAVPVDRAARIHHFRTVAGETLSRLPAGQRDLLAAYTDGVNAGLGRLASRPFEYLLLRSTPAPWKPEDCILVAHAMWLDLQDENASYERSLATLRDTLGNASLDFFAPLIAPDDAALDGSSTPLPPPPGPKIIDLRKNSPGRVAQNAFAETPPQAGSNSLALAGTHTANGAALLANDMHLTLRVPNIWYRASLIFQDSTAAEHRVTGVTLPGTPLVIAGSNGHIAWGFTNSDTDAVDLITIPPSDIGPEYYLREGEIVRLEKRVETIRVKGGDPVSMDVLVSPWGPVIGTNDRKQLLAIKWIADDPAATNFTLGELETATTAAEAVAIAHRSGIPPQNFLVADSTGAIAWTIAGRLPRRVGFDGRLPVIMAFGDRRWDGFVPEDQIPVISSPAASRLSTANQRLLGGDALAVLGDGGYEPPLRAARLQALLATTDHAAPADLLAIQLDLGAPYLNRWHELMEHTLNDAALAEKKSRAGLRSALEPWTSEATIDSASYRLVRAFRRQVAARALGPIFARAFELYPDFNLSRIRYEPALWEMLETKPAHLLDSQYATWDDLLLAAADDVSAEIDSAGLSPAEATWGRANIARIRHPLSAALPGFLARFLDMPAEPLPGDKDLPRVQTPDHGASERFAVSPGHEAEGIFHMPGGQSGHPLSPYYRAGHDAWVKGEPTPFLPGKTQHTLTLTP
jgi:penicillin amidase